MYRYRDVRVFDENAKMAGHYQSDARSEHAAHRPYTEKVSTFPMPDFTLGPGYGLCGIRTHDTPIKSRVLLLTELRGLNVW